MNGYVNIAVKDKTKKRFTELGKKGETYDDLLNRVIDDHYKYEKEKKWKIGE